MRTSFNIDSSQWPELWKAAYRMLEEENLHEQLRVWIEPLEFLGTEPADNGNLKIRFFAPNDWTANWVNNNYRKAME